MDISPQATCRGRSCWARAARLAQCERGKDATGRHRAESPSEPASSVQGAPKFTIPRPRVIARGNGSRLLVALATRLVQMRPGPGGQWGRHDKISGLPVTAVTAEEAGRRPHSPHQPRAKGGVADRCGGEDHGKVRGLALGLTAVTCMQIPCARVTAVTDRVPLCEVLRTRGHQPDPDLIQRANKNELRLVSRFRSSHHCAAPSFANFGIEGH